MDGEPYLGQLMLFPGPGSVDLRGWVPCDGRQLPVQDNEALASLLGSAGAGTGTFSVPDVPGPGSGVSYYVATRGVYPSPTGVSFAGQVGMLGSIELQADFRPVECWTPCNGDPITDETPGLLDWYGLMGLPAVLPDLPSPAPHLTYQICTYGTFAMPT